MFDSVGLSRLLRSVLYLNATLAIALATDILGFLPNLPYVSVISITVFAVSGLLFIAGETPLFPWLCGQPFVWRLFPNIDGEYEVEISSNWSVIEALAENPNLDLSPDDDVPLVKKMGKARIVARLTRIDLSLTMDDSYLKSETVTCSVRREMGERRPVLFYIYESLVLAPKYTDSQRHLGAGRVAIPLERRPTCLEGNYWTDRNWHQELNTAGQIRLRRIQ